MLAQFVVRLADLVEAEGRAARRAIFRLGLALMAALVATAVVLTAIGFFLAALFLVLAPYLTPPGALGLLGAVLLMLAAGCLAGANRVQQRGGKP